MSLIEHQRIRDDTLSLCDIGNRFAGTPGEVEAREFIKQRFSDLGLVDVREEPFEVATYRPRLAKCELVGSASRRSLLCAGLQFTESGSVEADAVLLGRLKGPNDVDAVVREAGGVDGRIAVIATSYPYLFSEALVARGAVGMVVTSDAPDGFVCHLNAMMYPSLAGQPNGTRLPVPGVTVEKEDAAFLLEHLSSGSGRVRLMHEADYEMIVTANVIGELRGRESDESVVLGGHYDSQLEGVGASDNASGIACTLEIARVLAEKPLHRSLVFAAFGDEEGGFRGSTSYCRRHAAEINRTRGMVNIDAPGWAPSKRSLHAEPEIMSFAVESAAAVNWKPDESFDASLFPGSDHNPFIDAGVPACFFWRNPPRHPYYHTAGDTPQLLDFKVIAETAEVARATSERLASIRELQLGRARPSQRWLDLRPETLAGQTSAKLRPAHPKEAKK
ncbi:MAG: M20/M25/M40 family metallo-hydrolase [Alphaproteobacteria bacterium]|nr:M20/M25/M40 family metallo-hydrolase [Alphaproteobacteria bacterium]